MITARRLALAACAAGAAIAAAGCESPEQAAPRLSAHERAPGPGPLGEPLVVGAPAGLESRVWVVMDEDGALDRALREAEARPVGGPAWTGSGLRLSIVPVERFEAFQAALEPRGLINRQWVGQTGRWTVAAAGPALDARGLVALDDGVAALGPGRLRLLVRGWAAPTEDGPRLRVEVAAQHRPALGARVYTQPTLTDEMEAGMPLAGLRAGVPLDGSGVLVITPLDVAAAALAEAMDEDAADEQIDAATAGPAPRRPRSAGEAMLMGPARERGGRLKTIIAIVGRPPESYRVLPGGGPTGGGSRAASQ